MVRPGDEFRVECREWTDAQIGNNDSANDVRDVDLTHAHMLSGPIGVEGAEPGDLLVVDILDLGPVPQQDRRRARPGLGLHRHLRQGERRRLPDRLLPRRLQGDLGLPRSGTRPPVTCPGVRYTGITHPGLFGTAPSAELLARLEPPGAGAHRHRPATASRRSACRRWPSNTLAGTATGDVARADRRRGRAHRARAGERRQPRHQELHPRLAGLLPRATSKDAKLSGGDLHFSQGDGEITFCGAIEMGGFIDFHVDLIKGGMEKYGVTTNPIFMPGNVEPRYSEFLTFIGISVDHDTDTNYYLDATLAYRRACLNAIEYLKKFGYTRRAGLPAARLGARSRGGSAASWTSPTPAARSTCPPRSSTSTCGRTRRGPSRGDRGQCAVTS